MERIKPPFIGMSGVELGFGLSQLARQLLDKSIELVAVDPKDTGLKGKDEDRVQGALWVGEHTMPTIRMRLHRYVTLAVAKQYPDLEMIPAHDDDEFGGRLYSIDSFLYQTEKQPPTPVTVAQEILSLCQRLMERKSDGCKEEDGAEFLSHQLDIALEAHSHICSLLWAQFAGKARELSQRDD